MIFAIAIPEILGEGLLFFRRALMLVRLGSRVQNALDLVNGATSDALRLHDSVPGDEAFHYLSGLAHIEQLQKLGILFPLSDAKAKALAFSALQQQIEDGYVPATTTAASTYLILLGFALQEEQDTFYDRLSAFMNEQASAGTFGDPTFQFLTDREGQFDASVLEIMDALGVGASEWNGITELFKTGALTMPWIASWTSMDTTRSLYKVDSHLSLLLTGARRGVPDDVLHVPVTRGLDTFALRTGFLNRVPPPPAPAFSIPDYRSVSPEMIANANDLLLRLHGYVKPDDGKGPRILKVSEAKVESTQTSAGTISKLAESQIISNGLFVAGNKLKALARLQRLRSARTIIEAIN